MYFWKNRKIVLFYCVLFAVFMSGHELADAGRTQYDWVTIAITVEDCNGWPCAWYTIGTEVTVNNQHWVDYHVAPYQEGHPEPHSESRRFTFHYPLTIRLDTECDGTECHVG